MAAAHRPDIDGLRALAVVPVVLFHAGLAQPGGGFVGVDVFFVISGFLITGILLSDPEAGRFSIRVFYSRRVRRLAPALLLVAAVSSLVAAWLLMPAELASFGRSLAAAVLFVSNNHFMARTGYFAAPADGEPLLHLWSLAVEEQYYVAFPAVLWLLWRCGRRWVVGGVLLALAGSLVYSLVLLARAPDAAFYSTPARTWELLAGSTVAIGRRWWPCPLLPAGWRPALAALGLGLVLFAMLAYSPTTAFPGLAALPPVVGTALLLACADGPRNPVGALLALPALRWVGNISYPLYLWHWPALVFARIYGIDPLSGWQLALLLGVVVVLSWLTWRWVEAPVRQRRWLPQERALVRASATGAALLLGGGVALVASAGWPGRLPAGVLATLAAADDLFVDGAPCQALPDATLPSARVCRITDSSAPPRFALWGDSHAEALLPALARAEHDAGTGGVFVVRGGCPPLLGVNQARSGYDDCSATADAFIAWLDRHPEIGTVVLASRWSLYATGERFRSEPGPLVLISDGGTEAVTLAHNRQVFEGALAATLQRLRSMGRRITVVAQMPEVERPVAATLARVQWLGRNVELRPLRSDYLQRQAFVDRLFAQHVQQGGLRIVAPADVLCPAVRCRITDGATPIYADTNHLTRRFAATLAPLFRATLDAAGH